MPDLEDGAEGSTDEVPELDLNSNLDQEWSTEGDPEGEVTEGADDAAEGEVDEELFTIKVKGAEKNLTRDELINLAQQGEDYTQKTQALAAERELAASYKALEQAFQKDPAATLAALAEAYGTTPLADIESMEPLERELHELKTWRSSMEADRRDQAIRAEFATVQQNYNHPDLDFGDLLAFAAENKSPSLDMAYKAMFWDRRPAAGQRQARVAAKRSAPAVAGGASKLGRVSVAGADEKMTLREAWNAALGGDQL